MSERYQVSHKHPIFSERSKSYQSPPPVGYLTVRDLLQKINVNSVTMYKYINNLPKGYVYMQILDDLRFRLIVKKEALELMPSNHSDLPEDAVSVSDLCVALKISSPTLYLFLHANGYYEKSIKMGMKQRRYYRIYFTREIADEIISKYTPKSNASYKNRLDDEINACYITPDLIEFLKSKTEIIENDGVYFLRSTNKIGYFIKEYMDSIGFMPSTDLFGILCLSRQRVHQLLKPVKDDDSICVQLNKSSHSIYVSKDFVKSLESRHNADEIPPGYVPISTLSRSYKQSVGTIRAAVAGVPSVMCKNVKYYNHDDAVAAINLIYAVDTPVPSHYYSLTDISNFYKVDVDILETILADIAHTVIRFNKYYDINVVTPVVLNHIQNHGAGRWTALSQVSRELNVNNMSLRNYLTLNGFIDSEYIKPKSGNPNGKALLIHPELIEHLKENKEHLKNLSTIGQGQHS